MKKIKTNNVYRFLGFIIILFLMACGGAKNTGNESLEFKQLEELVTSHEFVIENQWAMPLRGGNINLIGNANFIRFKGDSVEVFLPYFGVRHSGGGYGGEGGIKYEGLAKELNITKDEENQTMELKFEGQQGSENLDFSITFFPNQDVSISVTSSDRDAISYRGEVEELPEEE